MSFATLEEAWGVRSLVPPPAAAEPPEAAADLPPPVGRGGKLRRRPWSKTRPPGARDEAAAYAPAPAPVDDDADAQALRRLLARAYGRYGPQGVARLLPPGAMLDIANAGGGHRGGGRRSWRRWLARVFRKPETLLLVLLCAFALFVAWDAVSARGGAAAVPSLASLHMTPFSLGGSA